LSSEQTAEAKIMNFDANMWYRLTEKHTLSMLGVNSSPLPACVFFLRRHSSMHYLTPTKMRKFMRGNLA